jgi:hypothetical protein
MARERRNIGNNGGVEEEADGGSLWLSASKVKINGNENVKKKNRRKEEAVKAKSQ